MHVVLGTGVDYHKPARFYYAVMAVAVEYLAVLGKYGRKAHSPALGKRDALHFTDDLLLDPAGTDAVAGDAVHPVAYLAGLLYLLYLAGFLDKAQ